MKVFAKNHYALKALGMIQVLYAVAKDDELNGSIVEEVLNDEQYANKAESF